MRNRFVRAWHHIDRKRHLGKKQCVALKDYTDWVRARAHTFQMPYLLKESSLLIAPPLSSTTPIESSEEHLELVAKLGAERDAWEKKFHASEMENKKLNIHLKEKDEMLDIQDGWLMEKDDQIRHQEELLQQHGEKRKRQQEDLFSSSSHEDSVAWKEVADKLMVENAHLKAFYEDELEKLRRKLQRGVGSSSEVFPSIF